MYRLRDAAQGPGLDAAVDLMKPAPKNARKTRGQVAAADAARRTRQNMRPADEGKETAPVQRASWHRCIERWWGREMTLLAAVVPT